MVTTISVSEETKKKLDRLKIDLDSRSMDELLSEMVAEVRDRQFEESSKAFRKRLEEKGLSIEDVQEEGRKVRKEIYSEQFK